MMQQINLYDPALRRQRDLFSLANVLSAGFLLAVAVGGLGWMERQALPPLKAQTVLNDTQIKTLRDQISVLGQQAANRKPDPQLEHELGATRLLLDLRTEVLAVLKQRLGPEAESPTEYLRGFARQAMGDLWLTGFSCETVGGGMEIHGRTLDPALLPQYIQRLNAERAFRGRAFAALKLSEGKIEVPPGTPPSSGSSISTGTAAAPAARPVKPPFHEFTLIPVRDAGAAKAGKATETPAASTASGGRG